MEIACFETKVESKSVKYTLELQDFGKCSYTEVENKRVRSAIYSINTNVFVMLLKKNFDRAYI